MERIVSPEERIRRAEEIYYNRRTQGVRVSTSSVNVGKTNKISKGKKMLIQIIICLLIYVGFVVLRSYNNIFSNNIVNQVNKILEYDIDIPKTYNHISEYFKTNFDFIENTDQGEHKEVVEEEDAAEDNTKVELENEVETNQEDRSKEEPQAEPEEKSSENANDGTIKAEKDSENIEQMQQDAEYVQQNYSLIIPVEGAITSKFGKREETEIISSFHQGVDISAVTGTPVTCSMEGDVVAASFAGDYGNHVKIQSGEVLTVYAHCSELEVSVGDHVNQGQEIARVGSTGKTTGPHLHFEVRREGRYIDPELILKF